MTPERIAELRESNDGSWSAMYECLDEIERLRTELSYTDPIIESLKADVRDMESSNDTLRLLYDYITEKCGCDCGSYNNETMCPYCFAQQMGETKCNTNSE